MKKRLLNTEIMGKQKVNKLVFVLLILIGTMPLLDVLYPGKLEGVNRTVPIIYKSMLVLFLLIYFIQKQKKWWFSNPIGGILTLFIVIHILYLLVSSDSYTEDFFKLSKTLTWYFGFFFFLDLGYRQSISHVAINRFFTIACVLLFLLVFFGVTNEFLFKSNRDYGASNFAYYLLFILPFLFMNKEVPYRAIIFVLISIGVAISMKRGTMLLYIIMIIYLMFFSNLKGIAGKRFSNFFRLLIIGVVVVVLYQVVFSNFDNYTDKFSDISEYNENNTDDIGSGRSLLYRLPIERWLDSNIFNFLFGYGFNATPDYYPTTSFFNSKMYAHSDFVMLIHDYGVIGLSILISLFVRLFKLVKKNALMINKVPLFLIFIALLIKAIFSGFINYEYSIYGFAVLGLILGKQRLNYIKTKYQIE